MRAPRFLLLAALLAGSTAGVVAQLSAPFSVAHRHPAIDYWGRAPDGPAAELDRKLRTGEITLTSEGQTGFLKSVLDALKVAVESQVLVFSKTSFQGHLIGPANPRALYFNDSVAVGWVRGSDVLEFASVDPEQGAVFYTMRQKTDETPKLTRNAGCLSCHVTTSTMEVPGMFAGSVHPGADGMPLYAPVYEVDHRTPLELRWGGWYVTGRHGAARHMGNGTVQDEDDFTTLVQDRNQNVETLTGRVDLDGYLSPHSDIVALMVLEHQMHMANLITRIGWESRIDTPEARQLLSTQYIAPIPSDEHVIAATRTKPEMLAELKARPRTDAARELVDYMLFVDEATLTDPVEGTSDFAAVFAKQGPRDAQGRSLRDLDLGSRLMKYRCSYMIYSPAFEHLPADARDAIYARLWEVLSGHDAAEKYRKMLPHAERRAIVEILRDTKADLPAYFQPAGVKP
jgi:hypothetical protein